MNRQVNAIAGRLSLRLPQRRSLEILDRVTEIVPPRKSTDVAAALEIIRSEFSSVTDFEREFPSLCFALATGVGKTRLMGAFISYLHLAHGINNFFVLAPNLTIYDKLITDFTPNTPKYVFKGIAEFATAAPEIITGDNYEAKAGSLFDALIQCKINIFNISKINTEVRGGRSPRIKRLSEYIGESYFEYLAALPDLVLLMDESHRYRASAGVRAINELKPILGLELTATPQVETRGQPVRFKNIIFDYPLSQAMADGFVKEPAVVTRKNFQPAGMAPDEIERLKLEDGVRLHESVKVELETYARETAKDIVKPFLLVIARDTTHARQLLDLIQSEAFFEGRYRDKVIQVDSSQTGAAEEEMIERLLKVEHSDEPTEIVIHVNMLKEGWDVTNLYTIVPLRAAHARTLIEQSIGRGLRLPYGARTGVAAVDRLSIVAHDRFQEIVDEANRPGSLIRLQSIVLDPAELERRTVTVVSQPRLATEFGVQAAGASTGTPPRQEPSVFATPEEQRVGQFAYDFAWKAAKRVREVPSAAYLTNPEVRAAITAQVAAAYQPSQTVLDGILPGPDIAAIVEKATELIAHGTIDIPRITVVPKGEVRGGFRPFVLDLGSLHYPEISEDLWIKYLRTGHVELVAAGPERGDEERLENYVVRALVDFDDVSYDDQADLLYEFASQVTRHFLAYLHEPEEVAKVLRYHQRDIGRFVHAQMQDHRWEDASGGYEVEVRAGFTELKPSAYTKGADESILDYRVSPADKSNMGKYLFGGFARCLYDVQKFQSDPERKLAVILEREAERWFRPAMGQFQIFYQKGADQSEYQPDFVAETPGAIIMLEPKARRDLESPDVVAKRAAAETWCRRATDYTATYAGKAWRYALIPHDAIADNMTLERLVAQFESG